MNTKFEEEKKQFIIKEHNYNSINTILHKYGHININIKIDMNRT